MRPFQYSMSLLRAPRVPNPNHVSALYSLVGGATVLEIALSKVAPEFSWADTIVVCLINLLCGHICGIRDQEPSTNQHKYSDTSVYKADSRSQTARVDVVHVGRDELEQPSGQGLAAESKLESLRSQIRCRDLCSNGPTDTLQDCGLE